MSDNGQHVDDVVARAPRMTPERAAEDPAHPACYVDPTPWPEETPIVPLWPDAAESFRIGRSRAYLMARQGTFPVPVLRVGGRWMVLTAELRKGLGLPVTR